MKLSIGNIKLGSIPRVVGAISDKDISIIQSETVERIDILEFRIDMFENLSPNYIKQKFNSTKIRFNKPIISTIRSSKEGGYSEIDDKTKYKLFELVMPLSDAIDVEINSNGILKKAISFNRNYKKLIIGSYHNFNKTPDMEKLSNIAFKAKEYGADLVKIAVQANTKEDLSKLISFTIKNKDIGLITISLGNVGQISRILNPLIGSLLTYGYIGSPSAPGQIPALDIVDYLRVFDPRYNEDLINRLQLLEYV